MNFTIKVLSDQKDEPITIDLAKKYLRVRGDDDLIIQLICSARQYAERYMRIAITTKTIELSIANLNYNTITLPYQPIQSISSVCYYMDDSSTPVNVDYSFSGSEIKIFGPVSGRLSIQYTAGYGPSAVPSSIVTGILQHIWALYSDRNGAKPPRETLEIYKQYRIVRIW